MIDVFFFMINVFFGFYIFLTIFCVGLLVINPLKDMEDLVFCSIMSLLAIMFFIDAVLIDVERHKVSPQSDKRVIQCILQSATITCSLPQSNIQGEIK